MNLSHQTSLETALQLTRLLPIASKAEILEPSVGEGNFVRAILYENPSCVVDGCDIYRSEAAQKLLRNYHIRDFATLTRGFGWDWCIGNPPYARGKMLQHIYKALDVADNVAMLLPLAVLAGQERRALWDKHPFTVAYVLSKRPRFGGQTGTAPQDNIFVVWEQNKYEREVKWL